ncbi:branched-chain alpha-keto acid dehydrogenase subunit E2 [Haematobacter missouriensis]|uniref:Acetyltransferase component of pyruvate dehydrogenase complex n=1 Tax=Haematobacter missouriensis TaxID=366616 RepID=A0A212AWX2_9RHOB|nr:pyruvate dehydrogenase complex dihydrolipoamide acetyltransferase [Haematobacter missouriensis]KFI33977.1 branched-chain alpha-keto acid dehydrogenase subunit E2 [Haematobacter missouriensis]OWJ71253.1 pyruvate dehydrogenase complex dihydrolipoamide acetyltransferase [Haematobacter missouriensis]OWJ85971.1 pyruvate dehydrogenase complex dihydrolipoamide acetyltransferase [Haematobacter missouriensis]
MATEILMPALSPTMEEGTLAKWLVKEGDTVSSGDILAEIETDKATMEFEAVDEGVIGKILVPEGTAGVKVNAPIAVLVEEGESVEDAPASKAMPKAEEAPKQAAAAPEAPPQAAEKASARAEGERIFASPLARRIAAEKGIDLAALSGSGPHGRIVKADVETAKPGQPTRAPAAETTASAPEQKPEPQKAAMATGASADMVKKLYADRDYEEVTLDGMRRTIAARLTEAKQTIPHFYLRRDIRLDALMEFRQTLNHQLAGRGVKLSVNDFIIKAGAVALQQVPDANAVWAGDRILKLKPSDVAVAVAVEGGLFTPVIRDADKKSLSALSAEMRDLAHRARDRKLAPQEYQGGSFAISNLGMYGIDNFDAVINPPHGSILAVGAGVKKPVVGKDGEIEVATVMSVTLSVDHRVIDGALGAEFLKAMADLLENPILMVA